MDGTAKALAGGIATAKSLAGDAGGDGSGLRAALTGLLVQHVAATGVVIQTVAETGSLTGARTVGAVAALTANTNALGDAIGGLYGPAAKTEFLKQWNAHIGFFVTYTKGVVGKDAKLKALANKQLDGYRAQFGAFIEGATNKALPADAVAQELVGHIQTLEAAIDAIVAGKANASSLLSMAEMHMPFDGQSAILARGARRTPRTYVGNTVPERLESGLKPQFLALAPWVLSDGPRADLLAQSARLAPGSGDAQEDDYLETAVYADLLPVR